MARIIYPERFLDQKNLLTRIITEYQKEQDNSVLQPYLSQHDIDLSQYATAATAAGTKEQARQTYSMQAEKLREQRDNKFRKPFADLKTMVQYLKGLYRGAQHQLGDWGVTVNNNKIVYPNNFDQRAALWNTFYNHNLSLGDNSPLNVLIAQQQIDLPADHAAVTQAMTLQQDKETALLEAEKATQQRDVLWQPVTTSIAGIGAYLKKFYRGMEKTLGDWGFVVDDSPQKPRLRTTILKLGMSITNTSVIIGSTFTNVGTVPLYVYRGSAAVGPQTVVAAGEMMGIAKGYSTITIVNPSTLENGKFTVLVNR